MDNPKQFWSHLKSLRGIEKSDTLNAISPNKWVEHFSKIFEFIDFTNDNQRVLISQFTAEEISNGIEKLKNNKASGLDSISNEMIKASAPIILPFLVIFFNKILETKEYLDEWAVGIITPLHKLGQTDDPDNYRGITINSCLSKLFTLLVNNRLTKYINKEDALKFNQIGFRKGFATADHVLTLKTLIDKYLNRNQKLYICFLDFLKAYDSIWRKYLFHKLCMYGIHRIFISLLEDMYMKSKLSIRLPSGTTHFFPSSTGLKQGCNLSPILF